LEKPIQFGFGGFAWLDLLDRGRQVCLENAVAVCPGEENGAFLWDYSFL
jgi:hypothetical protein